MILKDKQIKGTLVVTSRNDLVIMYQSHFIGVCVNSNYDYFPTSSFWEEQRFDVKIVIIEGLKKKNSQLERYFPIGSAVPFFRNFSGDEYVEGKELLSRAIYFRFRDATVNETFLHYLYD